MEIGLRIFLSYSLLLAALFGFNLYRYLYGGGMLSLVITVLSGIFLAIWALAYFLYFSKQK